MKWFFSFTKNIGKTVNYVINYNLKFNQKSIKNKFHLLLKVDKYIYENGRQVVRTMTFTWRMEPLHINKDNAEDWPTMVDIKSYMTERKTKPYSQKWFVINVLKK